MPWITTTGANLPQINCLAGDRRHNAMYYYVPTSQVNYPTPFSSAWRSIHMPMVALLFYCSSVDI